VRALLRHRARQPTGKYRLRTVEQVLGDQGLEVAALSANAVLRNVHDARVELISQQHADGLRRQRPTAPVGQAPGLSLLEELFLRESTGYVLFERSPHERCALRIGHQAHAHRAADWKVVSALEDTADPMISATL
jgi:hypothetical protein